MLLPENMASPDRDANLRGKMASPAKLPVAATPKRDLIPLGKMTTPTKCLDVATPTKVRSRPSMGSRSRRSKVAQQGMGPDEHEGDELDNEEHDNTESSQGEEEVDEMLSPHAPAQHGTQVAVQDTLEHVLVAGKWAGLGAVRKANEVCVKVSGLRPHRQARVTEVHFQGQLVYRSIVCGPCTRGGKTCYRLNGHPCGQCMHDKKTCKEFVIESKCHLYILEVWIFDTDVSGKVAATTKRSRTVKSKQVGKLKPAPKVAKPSSPRRLHPVQSKPIIVDSLPDNPAGSSQEKGELAVGAKRKAMEEALNPRLAKRPIVKGSIPQVGELDQLVVILNGMWAEVVEAREAVSAAESRLRAVEGWLQVMDDWVRALHRRA